jgi:hypothetical protein
MRIESPSFTDKELQGFLDEVVDHNRKRLVEQMSALETANLPLCAHFEIHREQLERTLRR